MKLTVENFGPIRKARVDVRPMTVFVGHSNTGKSYLAMLIYITAKALSTSLRLFCVSFANAVTIGGNAFDEKKDHQFADGFLFEFIGTFHKQWEIEAIRCFGEDWEHMISRDGKPTSVVAANARTKVVFDFLCPKNDQFPSTAGILKNVKKRILSISALQRKDDMVAEETDSFPFSLDEFICFEIMDLLGLPSDISRYDHSRDNSKYARRLGPKYAAREGATTHYLPAVRGGLMQSHRIFISALVDRAPTIGLSGFGIIPFNGVLADFLQKILNIGELKQGENSISALSSKIERDIMRGNIRIKKLATRYPDFRYRFADESTEQRDISLLTASSSVTELAPIVLFIRYYLAPGDIFIVEEPEAHLHPRAQRMVAGVLVELVKAGVYVIVTTHSDIILEQISNFVYADKISGAKVLGKKAGKRALSEHETAVYSFLVRGAGKGTNVRKIRFSEETGFLTKDHLDVSSRLYNETVDLFNIRERENDI